MDVPEQFYFALSSATYNKNFEWVLATAAKNPDLQFVIAGTGNFETILKSHGFTTPLANVRHLGYVADDQRNWLYSRCAAFLFPSRYEGFGLPPLEAACLGAPVVVSDIQPMREIFGDEFHYVDPDVPAADLRSSYQPSGCGCTAGALHLDRIRCQNPGAPASAIRELPRTEGAWGTANHMMVYAIAAILSVILAAVLNVRSCGDINFRRATTYAPLLPFLLVATLRSSYWQRHRR